MTDAAVLITETPTSTALIAETLRHVQESRHVRDRYAALLFERRTAFDRDNAEALLALCEEEARLDAMEGAVRALALTHYLATHDKAPTPGVTIKEYDELHYEPAAALAWAKEKQMALVPESLNRKAFEKIAKAMPLPFVAFVVEPRAQIAADLDRALGGSQ